MISKSSESMIEQLNTARERLQSVHTRLTDAPSCSDEQQRAASKFVEMMCEAVDLINEAATLLLARSDPPDNPLSTNRK